MNNAELYHEPTRTSPPPGWICDTRSHFPEGDAAFCVEEEPLHPHFAGIPEHSVWETDPLRSVSTHSTRPGSSLRLSQWGVRAARQTGTGTPSRLEGELPYPCSNALVRRYTQWHPIQSQ